MVVRRVGLGRVEAEAVRSSSAGQGRAGEGRAGRQTAGEMGLLKNVTWIKRRQIWPAQFHAVMGDVKDEAPVFLCAPRLGPRAHSVM